MCTPFRGLHQLSSTLDPGIRIKDSVYFEFGVTQAGSVHGSGEEAVMKNSVITADFEVKQKVPEVFPSRHALERMKKVMEEKGRCLLPRGGGSNCYHLLHVRLCRLRKANQQESSGSTWPPQS